MVTCVVSIFCTAPDIFTRSFETPAELAGLVGQWLGHSLMVFLLMSFACVNKVVFAGFMLYVGVVGALLAYYKLTFNVSLTPMLVDVVLHNDARTSLDYISPAVWLVAIAALAVSVALVVVRYQFLR